MNQIEPVRIKPLVQVLTMTVNNKLARFQHEPVGADIEVLEEPVHVVIHVQQRLLQMPLKHSLVLVQCHFCFVGFWHCTLERSQN